MDGLSTAQLKTPAWRIHRDPTALPNPPVEGETPPNRFDDPQREYRVRYLATNKRGAFLEVLARFRKNDETQGRLQKILNVDKKVDAKITPGAVPRAFLRAMREVTGEISDSKHEFVDVSAVKTQTTLNRHPRVRGALEDSGLEKPGAVPDLDEATIRLPGPRGRMITQAVSRVVYDETEAVGIRYTSRLDAKEPCWAIFDWAPIKFSKTTSINLNGAELKSAAAALDVKLPQVFGRSKCSRSS